MAHATLSAEDEAYLAEHPAVRDVVQCIMYECLRKKPKDPIEHAHQYLSKRDLARSVSLTRAYVGCRVGHFAEGSFSTHLPLQSTSVLCQGPHAR